MSFTCNLCDRSFHQRQSMYRHQREVHGSGVTYTCQDCDRAFHRVSHLKRHQRTQHGDHGRGGRSETFNMVAPSHDVPPISDDPSQHQPMNMSSHVQPTSEGQGDDQVGGNMDSVVPPQPTQTPLHFPPKDADIIPPFSPVAEFSPPGTPSSVGEGESTDVNTIEMPVLQEDPFTPPQAWLPSDSKLRALYIRHWRAIRQHFHRQQPVKDVYNFRLSGLHHLGSNLTDIYDDQPTAFRVNLSFGFILRHQESGQLRYYYPSTNTHLFPQPKEVMNRQHLDSVTQELSVMDPLEWTRQQRPNTKWVVDTLTNMTFFVYKRKNNPIGAPTQLPDHLKNNKGLYSMVRGNHGEYNDNLCLFRCLAVHLDKADRERCESTAKKHLQTYLKAKQMDVKQFRGVTLRELDFIETLFQVNIRVYQLLAHDKEVSAQSVRRTTGQHPTTMTLNLYEKHFSYVKDMSLYAKSFLCQVCHKVFKQQWCLKRHAKTCDGVVKRKYPGGVFKNKPTIFEELADEGIPIPEEDRYFPYRACYDFEAYLEKIDDLTTGKTDWTALHVPMSVSVNSNVPHFESPVCFVSTGDPHDLIEKMMEYLTTISQASFEALTSHYRYVIDTLDELIGTSSWKPTDTDTDTTGKSHTEKLKDRFLSYLAELPVLGFNSGKYDMNLIKQQLYPYLAKTDSLKYVIKRNNDHMALSTGQLKFLDIRNYLAPNYSYDKWVKAYDCQVTKGRFCYAYVDSLERLKETTLPPREAFFNDLKDEECPMEEYEMLQKVWRTHHMKTLKDLLIWYNNLDVIPFMEAVEKMVTFYKTMRVDVFKDCISIPGLTLRYLFNDLQTCFSLIGEADKDMHQCLKDNIVGGPSIIFHRYHEKGVTRIRGGKTCQAIVGFDGNALYLACLASPMPAGHYIRWRPLPSQATRFYSTQSMAPRLAEEWLDWQAHKLGIPIRHRLNATEKRIGDRQLPVDGFADLDGRPTIFQFHGCYWHFHGCHLNYKPNGELLYNTRRDMAPEDLQNETNEHRAYFEHLGYDVVEMWKCYFLQLKQTDPGLQAFLQHYHRKPPPTCTTEQLLAAIKQDRLFGFVECDIHVPDGLKPHFAECPPIFKNMNVTLDDIGPTMAAFAKDNNIMNQPRRMLIGSMFGTKILLGTPLLKWYLTHGLEVTRIYQVMEYTPEACFRSFADKVTDARRQGDTDPSKALIGETMKLLGNSGYGKTITNQDRHVDVKVCDLKKTQKLLNNNLCQTIEEIDGDTYEVTSSKKTIKYDLPLQIGCMVYQYAKLHMFEFYYDFMAKYFDKSDWQYCEMDTDSAYMAWSDRDWESLVKPHLREVYEAERDQWLPRREHYQYDKRTPGLFKVEWMGDSIVGLCSKTYYCYGGESENGDKFSCKGVSRRHVEKELYLSVLRQKQSAAGTNRGMRVRGNEMFSYVQQKDAFTYFYGKRKVLDDGISTTYLDI